MISSPALLLTIPLSPLQHSATPPLLHHSATPPLPRDGNRFIFSVFRFIYPIWESRFAFKTNYDFFFKMTILKFTQTIILQFFNENFSSHRLKFLKRVLKKIKSPSLPLPFLQPGTCIVIHSCHNHSSQIILWKYLFYNEILKSKGLVKNCINFATLSTVNIINNKNSVKHPSLKVAWSVPVLLVLYMQSGSYCPVRIPRCSVDQARFMQQM